MHQYIKAALPQPQPHQQPQQRRLSVILREKAVSLHTPAQLASKQSLSSSSSSSSKTQTIQPQSVYMYFVEQAHLYGRLKGFENRYAACVEDRDRVQTQFHIPRHFDAPLAKAHIREIRNKPFPRVLSHYALLYFAHASGKGTGVISDRVKIILPDSSFFFGLDEDASGAREVLDAIGESEDWTREGSDFKQAFEEEIDVAFRMMTPITDLLVE